MKNWLGNWIKEEEDLSAGENTFKINLQEGKIFSAYRNVSIQNQSFDFLPFPMKLIYGQLGELKLEVPNVFKIGESNNKLSISKVFLCLKTT